MKNLKILAPALFAMITIVTLFIRVPLPTRGYFNFGDVAVIFGGLVLGQSKGVKGWLLAALVGGAGSATADVVGGFALFAPITLAAKGLEGLFAGIASRAPNLMRVIILLVAGGLMVGGYFTGEMLMPSIGLQAAIAELIPNIIQAAGGIIGGYIVFAAYRLILADDQESPPAEKRS